MNKLLSLSGLRERERERERESGLVCLVCLVAFFACEKTSLFRVEPSRRIVVDDVATTATVTFASPLPLGEGVLRFEYSGVLNNLMCGFYRSTYTDVKGA